MYRHCYTKLNPAVKPKTTLVKRHKAINCNIYTVCNDVSIQVLIPLATFTILVAISRGVADSNPTESTSKRLPFPAFDFEGRESVTMG